MLRKTLPSLKPRKVMSAPSWATAGRTRVSSSSFDGRDDRLVAGLEEFLVAVDFRRGRGRAHDRGAAHEMLHDGAEDRGLQVLPFGPSLETVTKS